MRARNSDQRLIFGTSLLASLVLVGLAWHFVVGNFVPIRYDLWLTTRDDLSHWRNLTSYLDATWPLLIQAHYPLSFTIAALPGVLLFGAVIGLQRRTWLGLAHATVGWAIGGILGFLLMHWVAMPTILLTVFVMPGLAFLAGGLAPVLLAPAGEALPVKGTWVKLAQGYSQTAIEKATKNGRTALAGVVLDRAAENEHVAVVGVTGSGKSVALRSTMFTALSRGDRHVVVDPDGGAMRLFYQEGDVILSPADARSAKWAILDEIEDDTDYRLLTEAVVPFPRDEHSEWVVYAREVFATCLETWHRNQLGSSDAFFWAMATADREKLGQLCAGTAAHRYFESGNERMLGSVMGTLAPALGSMRQLARVQGPAFSVRRWIRDGKGSLWMPY